ncbi:MAG: DUF3822 family protein [Flavobacteriales bacterium]
MQILKRDAAFKANEFTSYKFPYSLDNTRWLGYVKSVIETDEFASLTSNSQTVYSIEDSKVMLVPQALFTKEASKTNFEFLFGDCSQFELETSEIQSLDAVAIYGIPSTLSQIVASPVKSAFVSWLGLTNDTFQPSVKCHIEKNQVALTITKNDKLLFSNWFDYQKAEDVLYFFMATLETQKVLHSEVELTLSGEVKKGDEIHTSLTKFISKVSFAVRPKNLNYAYSFRELPEHKFPFIFAAACE